MTDRPPDSMPAEIQELRERIRSRGLRCTSARLAVMQRLIAADSPRTHAELSDELVPLGYDRATVFRNLNDLADAELVTRRELGDHVWRFELRDPHSEDGQHPHFVCIDCGSVVCMSDVGFDRDTTQRAKKVGKVTEILLKGHCNDCQTAN